MQSIRYLEGLRKRDVSLLTEGLREDVEIHVAVHDAPMKGREVAQFLFGVLFEEFERLEPKEVIGQPPKVAVTLEARIDGTEVQGVNILELDAEGVVKTLTVYFRPLSGLQLIAERVGKHMEARFGPRPDRA